MTLPTTHPVPPTPSAESRASRLRKGMGLLFVSIGAAALAPGVVLAFSFYGTLLGIPIVLVSAFWLHAGARLLKGGYGPNRTSRWLGAVASLLLLALLGAALSQLASSDLPRHVAVERRFQFRPFLWLEASVAVTVLWYLGLGGPLSLATDAGEKRRRA